MSSKHLYNTKREKKKQFYAETKSKHIMFTSTGSYIK